MFLGWIKDDATTRNIIAKNGYKDIQDYEVNGSGVGKKVVLTDAFTNISAPIPEYRQNADDCVSMALAMAVSTLMAVQVISGQNQAYPGEVATEPIHGGSRVEVNSSRFQCKDRGAIPACAVEWLQQWGILTRRQYAGGIDLSNYNHRTALTWQCTGVPAVLQAAARQHPIREVACVRDYAAARDALVNGYPVTVGTALQFNPSRNPRGFSTHVTWESKHYMCLIGVDDASEDKGVLCYDSYVDQYSGGERAGLKSNTFYIDPATLDALFQQEVGFTITGIAGFEQRKNLLALL